MCKHFYWNYLVYWSNFSRLYHLRNDKKNNRLLWPRIHRLVRIYIYHLSNNDNNYEALRLNDDASDALRLCNEYFKSNRIANSFSAAWVFRLFSYVIIMFWVAFGVTKPFLFAIRSIKVNFFFDKFSHVMVNVHL